MEQLLSLSVSHLYRLQGSVPEICGGLAQLGERLLCTQEVSGSIPLGSIVNEDVKIGDLIIEN